MRLIILCLLFLLTSCSGSRIIQPEQAAAPITLDQRILDERFDHAANWNSLTRQGVQMGVEAGVYRIQTQYAALVSAFHTVQYDHITLQADITFTGDNPQAIAGLICRSGGTLNPHGYYFLVSADGNFSIRRITENQDVALVRWQATRTLKSDGVNTLRVVCNENRLELYINGQYVDGATDSRYTSGLIALTAGLPNENMINPAAVEFDNLQVWSLR